MDLQWMICINDAAVYVMMRKFVWLASLHGYIKHAFKHVICMIDVIMDSSA
jgi:hypothetical protein